MSRPPEIEIIGGNPTPEEERAVREAILALWREGRARAAREAGRVGGWVRAGRAEAVGSAAPKSWRGAAGVMQPGMLPARRARRGDTR